MNSVISIALLFCIVQLRATRLLLQNNCQGPDIKTCCDGTTSRQNPNTCAYDPPCPTTAQCFADPCNINTCPAYPDASCTSNYCGGCNAVFTNMFQTGAVDVTDECNLDACSLPIVPGPCKGAFSRW